MSEQPDATCVSPPRLSVVCVPIAAVLVVALSWMVAADRGGDFASLRAGSVMALLGSVISPAVFLMMKPVSFALFTPIVMGLSMGRLMLSAALAGVVYTLGAYDAMWFWAPFAGAAGAMMVAEKAIAVAAAWPAVDRESTGTGADAPGGMMQEASA